MDSLNLPNLGGVRISDNFDEMRNATDYYIEIVNDRIPFTTIMAAPVDFENICDETVEVQTTAELINKFSHTRIGLLDFYQFRFKSEDVEGLQALLSASEVKITIMMLRSVSFLVEDTNLILRFIEAIRPEELYVHGTQEEIRNLMTPQFYRTVFPRLKYLFLPNYFGALPSLGDRVEDIPEDVDRFPEGISADYAEIIPFDPVHRAIQTWWRGEANILTWYIQLPSNYLDLDVLAKSIGLPHQFGLNWYKRRTLEFVRSSDGKKLTIVVGENEGMCKFTTFRD